MKRFIGFSDIGQFRNTIRNVIQNTQFQGMDENDNPI